ncbi:MAG: hypothetical protein ACO31I_11800 [Prochlorotrichaceae cyanobacterium]
MTDDRFCLGIWKRHFALNRFYGLVRSFLIFGMESVATVGVMLSPQHHWSGRNRYL